MSATHLSGPIEITGEAPYAGAAIAQPPWAPATTTIGLRNATANLPGELLIPSTGMNLVNAAGTTIGFISATGQFTPGGAPGGNNLDSSKVVAITATADNTATTLFTITIPNVTCRACILVHGMAGFDATPINDSARGWMYLIMVTRRAGVAAVAAIIPFEASATNPVTNVNQLVTGTIATLAAGATLTSALSLGSVTGGATVTETVAVQVTNVASAGTPTTSTQAVVEVLGNGAGGVTVA